MTPKSATPTLELQNRLGGKAGSWLAKGQQAVKSLEKKKIDGFLIPPVVSGLGSFCTRLAASTSRYPMSLRRCQ